MNTIENKRGLRGLGARWCPWCRKSVDHWANHIRWHHRDKIKHPEHNNNSRPPSASPEYRRAYYQEHKKDIRARYRARRNGGRQMDTMSAEAILDALAKLQKLVVGLQAAGVLS